MKYSKVFIEAWEKYSGLIWSEDYQGGFGLSFRDFKAGWDANGHHLSSKSIRPGTQCICEPYYANQGIHSTLCPQYKPGG